MTYEEFKKNYPVRLNPQQEAAVRQTEGPVLLLAVPGSGKTTVLVARIGYLLCCKEVSPRDILTVTYTVAAAGDMQRRFRALFGEKWEREPYFRTINGLCAGIIRRYAGLRGREPFALADNEGQLNAVLRELLARTGTAYPTEQQVRDARTHITYCKNMMLPEEEIHTHQVDGMDFPAVYFEYQDFLRRSRLMDYDDQMVFALRILRREPEILDSFQDRCRYICLDEAQDTSKIQHAILALLARKHRNLFMVGDEDQSIYGFRAAWPQALLEFEKNWPGARVLLMETNYRSTQSIVERADAFIQRNRDRHPKHMRTDNRPGAPVRRVTLDDYSQQYAYLAREAQNCGRPTAVLYRNNDSALPLVDLLERKGIPYACRQREGFFFTSPVVRDLTDILGFAQAPYDRARFLNFYYKLGLKIKKETLTVLLSRQQEGETVFETLLGGGLSGWQAGRVKAMQTHFSKLPQLSSFAALQRIVKYMGYGDYLKEQKMDTARLDVLLALAAQTKEQGAFLSRLEELRALTTEGGRSGGDAPFVLSTIHASKGLEYDRVLLIDGAAGVFPAVREGAPSSPEGREAMEEERRLFYVGATRAREELVLLTYANKFGEPVEGGFPFVDQLLEEEAASGGGTEGYGPGTELIHNKFGRGYLQSLAGGIAVIAFEGAGVKKVDLNACLRKGLVRRREPPV